MTMYGYGVGCGVLSGVFGFTTWLVLLIDLVLLGLWLWRQVVKN